MPLRKVPLVKNELYHIYNSSIAGFKIFNSDEDYERMISAIGFYMTTDPPCKLSTFLRIKQKMQVNKPSVEDTSHKLIKLIAFCIMPTHVHFILEELHNGGISAFENLISHSYALYFNLKYKRKGPLWEGRFKNILVKNDAQFLHLTRYIHLNPVTANLVDRPEDWKYSSYREYVGMVEESKKLCTFSNYRGMAVDEYVEFVNDQIGYQRDLATIKHLTAE